MICGSGIVFSCSDFPELCSDGRCLQVVLHYTLMTLNGIKVPDSFNSINDALGESPVGSLINRVRASCKRYFDPEIKGIDGKVGADRWREFISINCLRNHAVFDGLPVMNQIYVHAKLMIVDDRVAICGSANIK